MKIVVTCGPGSEPLDDVRRITNFSTGELGVLLANQLANTGHEVICFTGTGATTALSFDDRVIQKAFTTNDELFEKLSRLAAETTVSAVFHAAALCDFKAGSITGPNGETLSGKKIPSRIKGMTIHLVPAPKVLPRLPTLFPTAKITGWKYELEGHRDDAIAAAIRQIQECQIEACVVNGTAYGEGFGYCTSAGVQHHSTDKASLAQYLTELHLQA